MGCTHKSFRNSKPILLYGPPPVFPGDKIIFFVGRLVREKGVHILLEALPQILSLYPRVRLVIAGQGPAEGKLRQRAADLGISSQVHFTGYIDDRLRNRWYRTAHVAVFPSLYEPFGIVALEAMAAGTPVVVSDTGGLGEIVTHGVDGLKAYPGNPFSLAENILLVLREENLACTLRENALKKVREIYDWDKIAQRTLLLYQEVYSRYRQSPWGRRPWDFLNIFSPGPSARKEVAARPYDLIRHRGALLNLTRGREV